MLISPETLHFIAEHINDDVHRLALKKAPAGVDLSFALDQIQGRQTARKKLPSWATLEGILYPRHLSMEQCSSEVTGRYKRDIVQRMLRRSSESSCPQKDSIQRECCQNSSIPSTRGVTSMADLTGGLGGDFSCIAPCFSQAVYVERQQELCDLARHNFPLLGLSHAEVVCGDGVDFLQSSFVSFDLIFMDPARRDSHGGRTYGLSDCTPDVLPMIPTLLEKSRFILFKLSPMLDITQAVSSINAAAGHSVVNSIHVVSVDNECKELLVVLQSEGKDEPMLYCINLRSSLSLSSPAIIGGLQEQSGKDSSLFCCPWITGSAAAPVVTDALQPGQLLFEPNASIMKAGCFGPVAATYQLQAVSVDSHLFIADGSHTGLPGRSFVIERVSSMNRKALRSFLEGVERANVSVRHFPLSAEQLRKRLKLRDGGEYYLFATTTHDSRHVLLLCKKVESL